jgi:hypothetical protein
MIASKRTRAQTKLIGHLPPTMQVSAQVVIRWPWQIQTQRRATSTVTICLGTYAYDPNKTAITQSTEPALHCTAVVIGRKTINEGALT